MRPNSPFRFPTPSMQRNGKPDPKVTKVAARRLPYGGRVVGDAGSLDDYEQSGITAEYVQYQRTFGRADHPLQVGY